MAGQQEPLWGTEAELSLLDLSEDSLSCSPTSPHLSHHWTAFLRRVEHQEDRRADRIIRDSVHGHIVVPAVCQAVIDTEQFDRLRGLRQLGSAHYVYPSAKHTRWEHSLGVMHLSGQFITHLQRVRPGCATEVDRLCVMLAGLCHDLGHGPFSHLWEAFVREARPGHRWRHEKTSVDMLDWLIQANDLMPVFQRHGLGERDVQFVKEMIFGPFQRGEAGAGGWPYRGRGPHQYFLYEIVANKISSVDVDKWDYMLRDNAALGIGVTFDYRRFILHSDIIEVDGRMRITIRDKEASSVQEMFLDRVRLHNKGYQHRTIKIVDRMLLDTLLAADTHVPLLTDGAGTALPLSQACDHIQQFCRLTDEFLLRSIQHSSSPGLAPARALLHRLARRQLYKLIGMADFCGELGMEVGAVQKELEAAVTEEEESGELSPLHLIVLAKTVNMGMGSDNPVEKVLFHDKLNRTRVFTSDQLRQGLPKEVTSGALLVVCRSEQPAALRAARRVFERWSSSTAAIKPDFNLSLVDADGSVLTPSP